MFGFYHQYVHRLTLRRLCFATLAVLVSLLHILSGAEGEPGAQSPKGSVVELSVYDDNKTVTALVVWQVGDNNLVGYQLTRPFAIEWVVAPDKATGFQIAPLDATEAMIKGGTWISLKNPKPATPPRRENVYVSIRLQNGVMPQIDKKYVDKYNLNDPKIEAKEKALLFLPSVPTEDQDQTGWCYIGNWDPGSNGWKTLYWVEAIEGWESLQKRTKLRKTPKELKNATIVADFPVRMRKEPSSESPEVILGRPIRPGVMVEVTDVRYDVGGRVQGIWAQVKIKKSE
jgi:hypothetical protein